MEMDEESDGSDNSQELGEPGMEDDPEFDIIPVVIGSDSEELGESDYDYEDAEDDDDVVLDIGVPMVEEIEEGESGAAPNTDDYIDLANYDIGLPLEHSYLGGLNTLQSGRVIFSEGTKLKLPLVYLNGIILVPGQEIPFTFHHSSLVDFFRRVIATESKTFGMGYDSKYGTTAEIRSFHFDGDEVSIRAEGRQRFVITSKQLEMSEIYNAFVVIQPEIDLKNFFRPLQAQEPHRGVPCSTKELTGLTRFPQFVLRQYDDSVLMGKLRAILEKLVDQQTRQESFTYPEDPTAFSYFVLTCIPFSDRIKTKLLQLNCTTQRLRVEHALLSIPFEVRCAHCSAALASKEDFLVMSKGGTGGTYVNPAGIVHELFTFSKVTNVAQVSPWDDKFSWFPKYGWIIIRCRRCMLHLGWKFSTKENIKPKAFWSFTRSAIKLSFMEIEQDNFVYKLVHERENAPRDFFWNLARVT